MPSLSAYRRHLNRMREAIETAGREFEHVGTLEADERVIKLLAKSLACEIEGLTETITDERVGQLYEDMIEGIGVAFMDAKDKRDDRRSPESRADYVADTIRSMA
mgnify:FL=1